MQLSEEWFAARLGKVTASKVYDIMAKTKSGYSTSRANYMSQLLCERLTGAREVTFTNSAMQRGTEKEPLARIAYEMSCGILVDEVDFINHPTIKMAGASPDGLVGDEGLVEIKCPNTNTHIEFMRSLTPDTKYQSQMLWQMACTERKWCDFVSFDDRLPEEKQMRWVRFHRDDAKIAMMEEEVRLFLTELDELIIEINKL